MQAILSSEECCASSLMLLKDSIGVSADMYLSSLFGGKDSYEDKFGFWTQLIWDFKCLFKISPTSKKQELSI